MQDVHDHVSSDQLAFASGTTGPETSELNQLLLRKIRTHRWLSGLGVMNKNGVFVGAVNRNRPQDVGADFSFRKYFSYLASHKNENQYFSPVFKETETDDIWLACSRALRLKQGQFDGVIFAGLSGRYLADEMGDINFAEGGSIAIVDIYKGLWFRNPPVSGTVGGKVVDPNLDAFLSSGRDSLTYIGFSPFDNKRKIISFQRTHQFPYMVAVASNVESELVGWYQKGIIYSFGWLLSMIILFLLTYILIRLNSAKNRKLQRALEEIKTLEGILPIWSYCKKIRDDKGYWEQVEVYVSRHSHADFSHSICPD